MSSGTPPRLALRRITKRYASVLANDAVDLEVAAGEIHAVVGENGAGKSTLMKIICGVVQPDAGSIEWDGDAIAVRSPAAARRRGIGMVFQQFALFETLTVSENIALALDRQDAVGGLDSKIADVSQRYGLPVVPQRLVHGMSVGERQRVEIVRCLLQNPRLLIMDEPTSVLTPLAVTALFGTLRTLALEGVSILYVSHKLDEIRELCDVATVLRNGRVTGTAVPRLETNASLSRMMVGGELNVRARQAQNPGVVRLEIDCLSIAAPDPFGTDLRDVDLKIRGGEIVGIAGVSGNGQMELLGALSGEKQCGRAGAVRLRGRDAGRLDPAQRRRLGLRFVPEERLGHGAVPTMDLIDNSVLTNGGLVRHGFVRARAARAFARDTIAQFAVHCAGEHAPAQSLSGGNLQKFIVGREIRQSPEVMIVAQPTWGVDVGAAVLIHQALLDLRDSGVAILVVSEELDELFSLCDRIAVMAQGRLSTAVSAARLTRQTLGEWMTGAFTAESSAARPALVAR